MARAVALDPADGTPGSRALRGRVLLVSSTGGVFLDLLALAPWWRRHDRVWALVRGGDTASALEGEVITWITNSSYKRPLALLRGCVEARRILRAQRPAIIVSAGSGPAIPFFALARLFGIPTLWLSTLNLVGRAGVSARICSRLASRVLVQRPSMLAAHSKAVLLGELY